MVKSYRQSIGLYNTMRFVIGCQSSVPLLYVMYLLLMLIIMMLSWDVETNPGLLVLLEIYGVSLQHTCTKKHI